MRNFFSQTSRLVAIFPLAFLLISCGASDAPGLVSDAAIIAEGKSSVLEGDSGVSPLTLSFVAPVSGLIKYTTFDITAVARSDYLPVSGEFTAVLGERYAIQVDVLGDIRIEGTERFGVRLFDEQDQIVGEIIGEIINDDFPDFSVSSPVVAERNTGQTPLVFTVSLSAEPIDDFVLQVKTRAPDGCVTGYANATQSAECAQDYMPLTTTLTFREGESLSQTITVQVLADTQVEPDEILELDVTFQEVAVTGKGIIRNDDDATQVFSEISMNPARFTETETNGCVRFEYRLRDAGSYNLNYRLVSLTNDDWASRPEDLKLANDNDFRSLQGQVVFSDEQSSLTVCGISIVDDKLVETSEVFAIKLFNTEGAQFYTGYIFITDNDFPDFKLGVKGQTPPSDNGRQVILQEPDSGQNEYSLLFQSDFPVTDSIRYIAYKIENEVSFGENPDVIKILPGTLNFSESEDDSGGYSASIEITVLSDNLTERDELFRIGLANANGQPLFDSSGNQQLYDVIIRDSQSDALELLYSCKDTVSEVNEQNEQNVQNVQSCKITWENNIAENALPITLTHELLPCDGGDICASNDDFDHRFLSGVVVGISQAAYKKAIWTFEVQQDELVEALETATIKTSARYAKDDALVNIIKKVEAPEFKIQDGDTLTLGTVCNTANPGESPATGSSFMEGDAVECIITTNTIAGNVPGFELNAALADSCAHGQVCADSYDFESIQPSVTFIKPVDGGDGIRTASWSSKIKKDSLVEASEAALFDLSVQEFVTFSGDTERTIRFDILDADSLIIEFSDCPAFRDSTGSESESVEGSTVFCTATTINTVAANVPDITLTVAISDCNEVGQTGSSNKDCADSKDFGESLESSVTFVISDNGIRIATWSADIKEDNLVELAETARFNLSVDGPVILDGDARKTIEFKINDGDDLTVNFGNCPSSQGTNESVSVFNEGDTVTCKIQTNAVAANVPAIMLGVELLDCSVEGEEGSSDVVCAESADYSDDAQVGFPTSLVLSAVNGNQDGVREATWSAIVKADNLIEKQETANFVMTVTAPDDVSVDGSSVNNLNFGFNINDGDRLVISYPPGVVNEGDSVRLTASPAIAESVGPIAVSLSLAGCANSEGIACADGADFNDIPQDNSLEVAFDHENPNYLLEPMADQIVEHTEKAAFKVSVSKEFSPYFKQSEQSDIQGLVVGISSFSDEDNAPEYKEISMTMSGDELSGSFTFDIADNDKFEFSLSRVALEGEEYLLTAVGAYQFHSKAVNYTFGFTPEVMLSNSDNSCFVGSADIHCLIEDDNKLSSDKFLGNEVPGSKSFISENGQDIEGSEFSIPVRLTNSSPLQTLASWFAVAVDGNAPGIKSSLPINQPMLALNAETQSISVPSVSADSGAIYPAINHIYLNKSGELMVPGKYDCMIDNLTGLFWMRGSNLCNFKESDPKIDNAQGRRRPTISELLSLYSDQVNPIFEGLTGEIQSSSACSADNVYWFSPDTGAVSCSPASEPVVPPAETPELFVIPFKEGSLQ